MKQPKVGELRIRERFAEEWVIEEYDPKFKRGGHYEQDWRRIGVFDCKSDAQLFVKAKKRIGEGK